MQFEKVWLDPRKNSLRQTLKSFGMLLPRPTHGPLKSCLKPALESYNGAFLFLLVRPVVGLSSRESGRRGITVAGMVE
jgi:hypothetical protein